MTFVKTNIYLFVCLSFLFVESLSQRKKTTKKFVESEFIDIDNNFNLNSESSGSGFWPGLNFDSDDEDFESVNRQTSNKKVKNISRTLNNPTKNQKKFRDNFEGSGAGEIIFHTKTKASTIITITTTTTTIRPSSTSTTTTIRLVSRLKPSTFFPSIQTSVTTTITSTTTFRPTTKSTPRLTTIRYTTSTTTLPTTTTLSPIDDNNLDKDLDHDNKNLFDWSVSPLIKTTLDDNAFEIDNKVENFPNGLSPDDIDIVDPGDVDSNEIRRNMPPLSRSLKQNKSKLFDQPGILAGLIFGCVVTLICMILIAMLIIYRLRAKLDPVFIVDRPNATNARSPQRAGYIKAVDQDLYS